MSGGAVAMRWSIMYLTRAPVPGFMRNLMNCGHIVAISLGRVPAHGYENDNTHRSGSGTPLIFARSTGMTPAENVSRAATKCVGDRDRGVDGYWPRATVTREGVTPSIFSPGAGVTTGLSW